MNQATENRPKTTIATFRLRDLIVAFSACRSCSVASNALALTEVMLASMLLSESWGEGGMRPRKDTQIKLERHDTLLKHTKIRYEDNSPDKPAVA